MPDILKTLISRQGFDRRADVAISMPHDTVFFRNLETDSAGLEQIDRLSVSALEHNFPMRADEIVAQVCSHRQLPDGKYSVLVAAATRASLRERLNLCIEANMHPKLAEAAILAVYSTIAVNHPEVRVDAEIIAHIDESYLSLAITQDNNILIARNIPVVSRSENNTNAVPEQLAELLSSEVEITWRKVVGVEIEQNRKIYLAAEGSISDDFKTIVEENLHCQIVIVDPYAKVKNHREYRSDVPICVAEGVALRLLMPEETTGVNFLETDNADIKPALNLKKEFITCAALVVAIAIVLSVGLFVRLSYLETKYAHVKNEIIEIFQRTLPEERNIVNPLVQLEQKLQSLRTGYTLFGSVSNAGIGPFEVLHALTTSVPLGVDINIDDMLITTESARLTGTCPSFESVYNWQRLLRQTPQFSSVDVQNVLKEPDTELIHFTISMSLAALE